MALLVRLCPRRRHACLLCLMPGPPAAAPATDAQGENALKIILLGDSACGKSKLVERFLVRRVPSNGDRLRGFQPATERSRSAAPPQLSDYQQRQLSTYALTLFRHNATVDGTQPRPRRRTLALHAYEAPFGLRHPASASCPSTAQARRCRSTSGTRRGRSASTRCTPPTTTWRMRAYCALT